MSKTSEATTFRGADKQSALDALSNCTKMPLTQVLRELIPPLPVCEAMILRARMHSNSGRGVPSNIAYACVSHLIADMEKNPEHDCQLQMELYCGSFRETMAEEAPGYNERIAMFYQKWVKAEMGDSFYRFEKVIYKGKARFPIVIGPEDTKTSIDAWKKQVVDYAKKLGVE